MINNIYKTKKQLNSNVSNDLLNNSTNNSIDYSYSNFSFDSKKYLMNYGLIEKR